MLDRILAWFARNGVAANLTMLLIVVGGLLSLEEVRITGSPDISFRLVTVSVRYPGASPEEVELGVCARVEQHLRGLETVQRMHSLSMDGQCYVRLFLTDSASLAESLDLVKARISTIDSFPEDVEKPVVQDFDLHERQFSIVVSGPTDTQSLARLGERLRDGIAALPEVTVVELLGVPAHEISVEVSETDLRRHNLDFDQVADRIRRSSLDLPSGSVKARGGEINLKAQGQAYSRQEFDHLILLTRPDGTRLTLGEVARISDGFAEAIDKIEFDGEPAVQIDVFRIGNQNAAEIVSQVRAYLEKMRLQLPRGIKIAVWDDNTVALQERLGTLLKNGLEGLLLVLLVLALFLRPRLAGWVAAGIPISFLGALWLFVLLDQSINMQSLLGFIVVLGLIVDDAIVVGENIYRHHQAGKSGEGAAVAGVCEVARPVILSSLTTILAFSPLAGLPGTLGQLFRVIPIVVGLALVLSLGESLLILPSHLSNVPSKAIYGGSSKAGWWRPWDVLQIKMNLLLEYFVRRIYRPLLAQALAWRYLSVALAVVVLLVSFGLVAGGRVGFYFFPPIEARSVSVALTFPQGTPADVTSQALHQIERGVEKLRGELAASGNPDALRHVLTTIGRVPMGGFEFADPGRLATRGSHLGGVSVELAPADQRTISAFEIQERLRRLMAEIPDALDLSFNTSFISVGKAIDIEISGDSFADLGAATRRFEEALRSYPGVYAVADSLRPGKQEIRLSTRPEAEAMGIDLSMLSKQVRQGFHGVEVQRIQRGRNELKVMLRYPAEERRLVSSLENMRIRTSQGVEVPFSVVGRIGLGRGFSAIERVDSRRTVRITADIDPAHANGARIIEGLRRATLPGLAAAYPGLAYSFAGEQRERRESLGALGRNTLLAILLIYALLAVGSASYLQPLVIMGAIPFSTIGAIWGHLIMGFPLTFWSLLGIVALAGVVINDNLVLVDSIERLRGAGVPLADAVTRAGEARFRPIVLTSLTTFAGLAPLIAERGLQARFLVPIAISLAFGVLLATVISLFLVPVGYSLVDDARAIVRRRQQRASSDPVRIDRSGPAGRRILDD